VKRPSPHVEASVARLLRWYPKDWRDRYGDEFGELLAEQIADQPRSLARTLDIALGATMARLAAVGLTGTTVNRSDLPRRSLATLGCALALFLTFATSIWTHLTLASRSADPATTATRTAILIMTVALTICLATAAVSAIPVVWAAAKAAGRPSGTQLRAPTLLLLAGIATLTVGAIAFHAGWAVTRGQPWSQQSIGPSGPASFLWASTLSVSAYWAHPAIVLALPPSEIAWMLISPAALVASIIGGTKILRRLDLSTRLFSFLGRAAQVATAGLGLFVFGTLLWLIDGGGGPAHLFQAGTVDRVGLLVMTATLIVSLRSTQRAAIPLSAEP
jgi:hypothetical protein